MEGSAMSGAATATVETLTAEVRVLMVGSRQVTLSVFNQLDVVCWAQLEQPPFGRVSPRQSRRGCLHLVGKHCETGTLVSAQVNDPSLLTKRMPNSYGEEFSTPYQAERGAQVTNVYGYIDRGVTWPHEVSWDDARDLFAYFKSLPLIVLAGLR